MTRWAACTSVSHAASVAHLRLLPAIEAAELSGMIWVRGTDLSAIERALNKIPAIQVFELLESDRLRPLGSRIPERFLPKVSWRPIRDVFPIRLPATALSGETNQKLSVQLVRASEEQPAAALLTKTKAWTDFAIAASEVRLEPLRFASCENGDSLVIGTPLPALSGTQWVHRDGILTPCGFSWTPHADASVLRELFSLGPDDVVLLFEDNTHQVIRSEQFVAASRSAARLTLQESRDA